MNNAAATGERKRLAVQTNRTDGIQALLFIEELTMRWSLFFFGFGTQLVVQVKHVFPLIETQRIFHTHVKGRLYVDAQP